MRIRLLALCVLGVASLFGQKRFSWQDYCFNHPAAAFCPGHEYAVKNPKPAKGTASTSAVTNPFPPSPRKVTPSIIVVGAVDWRFADPFSDVLIGFNFNSLAASPLVRDLIAQLGTNQGLSEADMREVFDRLSGVDQIVLSVRGARAVAMVTGRVADSAFPAVESGLKAVPVSGGAALIGHADAVDQAVQRMKMKGPMPGSARLAEELQAKGELWAVGSALLAGPQAVSAGVKQFSLTVSMQDRLTSDVSFEFNGPPNPDALRMWQSTLGASATLEGSSIHVRTSMEPDEWKQKVSQINNNPLGESLGALIRAARYLPVHEPEASKPFKPMIYGLDSGPKK